MKRIASIVLLLAGSFLAASGAAAAEIPPKLAGAWMLLGSADSNSCGIGTFENRALLQRDGSTIGVDPALGTAVGETKRIGSKTYEIKLFGLFLTPGGPVSYEILGTAELVAPGEFDGTFYTTIGDCTASGTIQAFKL